MQKLKRKVSPSSWRQKNKIAKNTPMFLFCGRLNERKGVEIALSAFIKFHTKHSEAIFCIVGSGLLQAKLEKKIRCHNLSSKVILTGFLSYPELADVFFETHALILPSVSDPSPKIINEVMNFGKPVIVSENVGTAGDLVRHGENGYIVHQHKILLMLWKIFCRMRFIIFFLRPQKTQCWIGVLKQHHQP
jgi:glycosyltransferase involved in cell wall biosynthesis